MYDYSGGFGGGYGGYGGGYTYGSYESSSPSYSYSSPTYDYSTPSYSYSAPTYDYTPTSPVYSYSLPDVTSPYPSYTAQNLSNYDVADPYKPSPVDQMLLDAAKVNPADPYALVSGDPNAYNTYSSSMNTAINSTYTDPNYIGALANNITPTDTPTPVTTPTVDYNTSDNTVPTGALPVETPVVPDVITPTPDVITPTPDVALTPYEIASRSSDPILAMAALHNGLDTSYGNSQNIAVYTAAMAESGLTPDQMSRTLQDYYGVDPRTAEIVSSSAAYGADANAIDAILSGAADQGTMRNLSSDLSMLPAQDFGGADTSQFMGEFQQNLQDIYDNRGGFTSQWQTVGSDRIMIQDDGSAIGINTETGEQYALSPQQVQQMIDRKLLNTYESGYYTATGGNRNGPGGSGKTASEGSKGSSGGGGGAPKSKGAIGAGMAALSPGGGGALPGSLRETMLAAAPVGQSSNTSGSTLRQLSDTLGPLDARALQTIKAPTQSYYNYGSSNPATTAATFTTSSPSAPQVQSPVGVRGATSPLSGLGSPTTRGDAATMAGLKAMTGDQPRPFRKGGNVTGHNNYEHIPEFITGKTGNYVRGRGDGQSDSIPAMLADGEYVFDADTVAALGNGSNEAGARALDEMRIAIRKHKRSAPHDKIPPKAKSPLAYMKG